MPPERYIVTGTVVTCPDGVIRKFRTRADAKAFVEVMESLERTIAQKVNIMARLGAYPPNPER